MSEVADAGEDHRHLVLVCYFYRLFIPNRATGLHNCSNTAFAGKLDPIREGEEGVRGGHAALQLVARLARRGEVGARRLDREHRRRAPLGEEALAKRKRRPVWSGRK